MTVLDASHDFPLYDSVYIAGPMTGIPQFNFPAFDEAARFLRGRGLTVISPSEIDDPAEREQALASTTGELGDVARPWGEFLTRDVAIVLTRVDAVVVLPGWSRSRGAVLEVTAALCARKYVLGYRHGLMPVELHLPDPTTFFTPTEAIV